MPGRDSDRLGMATGCATGAAERSRGDAIDLRHRDAIHDRRTDDRALLRFAVDHHRHAGLVDLRLLRQGAGRLWRCVARERERQRRHPERCASELLPSIRESHGPHVVPLRPHRAGCITGGVPSPSPRGMPARCHAISAYFPANPHVFACYNFALSSEWLNRRTERPPRATCYGCYGATCHTCCVLRPDVLVPRARRPTCSRARRAHHARHVARAPGTSHVARPAHMARARRTEHVFARST